MGNSFRRRRKLLKFCFYEFGRHENNMLSGNSCIAQVDKFLDKLHLQKEEEDDQFVSVINNNYMLHLLSKPSNHKFGSSNHMTFLNILMRNN